MSDWQEESRKRNEAIDARLAELGLTLESVFIPYSQSRNAKAETSFQGKPWPTLNWKVTLKRQGRDVLTTDYSAGTAHCPAYKRKEPPSGYHGSEKNWRHFAVNWEIENGFAARPDMFSHNSFRADKTKPIVPLLRDVLYSLVSDYSVLDCPTFEDWASELGFDPDSRKGEKAYRACLELALQMRASLGDETMRELQELFQDY